MLVALNIIPTRSEVFNAKKIAALSHVVLGYINFLCVTLNGISEADLFFLYIRSHYVIISHVGNTNE